MQHEPPEIPDDFDPEEAARAPTPVYPAAGGTLLTTVGTVYYQTPDAEPIAVEARAWRQLPDDEEPYTRRLKVGAEWRPVETGWVECPGLVVLKNPEAVDQKRVVEVGVLVGGDVVLVRTLWPGEMVQLDAGELRVRCPSGSVRVLLLVLPR